VWVHCVRKTDDDPGWFERAEMGSLLGPDDPFEGRAYVQSNPRRKRVMGNRMLQRGYSLVLTHRERFLRDGSALNKSIRSTTMASGLVTSYSWLGPVVAVRQTTDEMAIEDITLGDFRHAADHFADYADDRTRDVEETAVSAPSGGLTHADRGTRRGVAIHCDGAIQLHGKQPFSQVEVPAADLARRGGELSPISKLVGLPVRLRKIGDIREWLPMGVGGLSNQNAAFLMMGTDPNRAGWGWAPPHWQTHIGDVLVVGDEGRELVVEDVALLSYFCRKKLQPLFEDALGLGLKSRSKEEVLDFITGENMERFREEARHWMVET
jgi:hypothetical protein